MTFNPLKNRKIFFLLMIMFSAIWYVQSPYLPKTVATVINLVCHQSVHLSGISGTLFSRSFKIKKITIRTDHVDIKIDDLALDLKSFTWPIDIQRLTAHSVALQIKNHADDGQTTTTHSQNALLEVLNHAAQRSIPMMMPMNIKNLKVLQVAVSTPLHTFNIQQLSAKLELMINPQKPLLLQWQTTDMLNPANLWIERHNHRAIWHLTEPNVHNFAIQIDHPPHQPIDFEILKPKFLKGVVTGHGRWPDQATIQGHDLQLLFFKHLGFHYQSNHQVLRFDATDPSINFSLKLNSKPDTLNAHAQIGQLTPWLHDINGACSIQLQKNHQPVKWQANCSNLHFKSWQVNLAQMHHQQSQTSLKLQQIFHPIWDIHDVKAQLKSSQNQQYHGTFDAHNARHQIAGQFQLTPKNNIHLVMTPIIQFDHQDIPIYLKAKSLQDFQVKALNVPIKHLAKWIKMPAHLTLNPVGNINFFLLKTPNSQWGSGHLQLNQLQIQSHKNHSYILPQFNCMADEGKWTCDGQIDAPNHGKMMIDLHAAQEKIIIQNQFKQFNLYVDPNNYIDVDGPIEISLDRQHKIIHGSLDLSNGKIMNLMTSSDQKLPEETIFYQDSKSTKRSFLSGKIQLNFQNSNQINLHGLTGQLGGQLALVFVPANSSTEATGELSIDNPTLENLKDIKVTQFRLSYHHQPLTNPYLDIRLTRDLQPNMTDNNYFPTTINLNILGAFSSPHFRINSDDQSLTDHQSLMALLTGDSSGNVSGMNQVTQLLSGFNYTSSNPISRLQSIAHLDQLSIKPNLDDTSEIGASIKVGKSISKKISVSYEMNSHNEDYNASLQYLINQLFTIQVYKTQAGKGANIMYQKDFN